MPTDRPARDLPLNHNESMNEPLNQFGEPNETESETETKRTERQRQLRNESVKFILKLKQKKTTTTTKRSCFILCVCSECTTCCPPSRPSSSPIGLADLIGSQLSSLCAQLSSALSVSGTDLSPRLSQYESRLEMQASQKNRRVCMKIKHILYYIYIYLLYTLYIINYQLQLQIRVFNFPTSSKLFSSFKNIIYGFKICVGQKQKKRKKRISNIII